MAVDIVNNRFALRVTDNIIVRYIMCTAQHEVCTYEIHIHPGDRVAIDLVCIDTCDHITRAYDNTTTPFVSRVPLTTRVSLQWPQNNKHARFFSVVAKTCNDGISACKDRRTVLSFPTPTDPTSGMSYHYAQYMFLSRLQQDMSSALGDQLADAVALHCAGKDYPRHTLSSAHARLSQIQDELRRVVKMLTIS